jgi:Zn-finger nucleic acid-binding protein
MLEVTEQGVTVDRCEGCGGIFFDGLEHEQLKAMHAAAKIDIGEPALGRRNDKQKVVLCPHCNTGMLRLTIHGQSHIHVDSCPVCYGTYFDAGEFVDYQNLTFGDRIRTFFGVLKKPHAD